MAAFTGLLNPALLAAMAQQQPQTPQGGLLSPGMWSRMGDSLVGAENTGADRRGLLGQALLGMAAGMAQTGGQGFMGALGNGIQSGLLALNQGRQNLSDERYRDAMIANQGGDPAGFRAMDMQARAAGYEPGTQGYKDFFRRANGELARQSSAAISYEKVKGPDGREYMIALDPRAIGAQTIGGGPSFGSFAQPAQATRFRNAEGEVLDVSEVTDPAVREQIIQNPEIFGLVAEEGGSVELPGRDVASFTPAPVYSRPSPTAGRNPFASRTPEEEAAAITAATERTKLALLPTELRMRTDAAIDQAAGIGQASAATEAAAKATAAQKDKDASFRLYEVAMQGAREGLEGSTTGPVMGRLPAVTAAQQTAQGGVAALTPVLKQIFRSAGEGSFTDSDQRLLLEMVPTRADLPEARDAKLANIDRIVRAKLGQGDAGTTPAPAGGWQIKVKP